MLPNFWIAESNEGMHYRAVTEEKLPVEVLNEDFGKCREIGKIRLGEKALFFRKKFSVCYIPYSSMERAFRRVMQVPMTMCCGKGELQMENLVICDHEKEVAVLPIPGTKAAKIVMGELGRRAPGVKLGTPLKEV